MTMEIHNAYKYNNYFTNKYSISPFLIKKHFLIIFLLAETP